MARVGRRSVVACLPLLALLPGCRLVRTSTIGGGSGAGGQNTGGSGAAGQGASGQDDPQARAASLWDARILPYLQARAGAFETLRAQIASDPAGALRAHGYRPSTTDAPPVYIARLEGRIVAADTASMAGTVDVAGAGGSDAAVARVQIGPVIRGTALRDSLAFVGFDQFANQIDYADFARALNHIVRDRVVHSLPRTGLLGRHVSIVGVFRAPTAGMLALVTPAVFTLGGAG